MAWWSPPTSCEKPSPPSGMHGLQKWGIRQWGLFLSECIVKGATNRFKADIGVCLIVVQLLLFVDVPPPPPDHLTQPEDPTQSRRVFAEFYQATTFSILTPLAAAVCAESDNQQDMGPEDSEPYFNTSDSDTTIATTDTEAAGPTPPPPPNNKKCSGGPVPPPWADPSLTQTGASLLCSPRTLSQLIRIGFTRIQWDGIQSRPLVDVNGHIFAVLAGRPNIPAYAPAVTHTFDLLAMSTTTS
ncbi:hypothetical protein B0H16DRAFT_1462835 [Mycena metata]|uniref:Uncharacterized protein n=1 Tax=Mycena metata TaxID=1033252 RepID=A0AAD7N3V6_9AGAR|nr:hypothetical protein B0H16DRAFT_1462835 [Mycena metata]